MTTTARQDHDPFINVETNAEHDSTHAVSGFLRLLHGVVQSGSVTTL